MSHTLHTPPMEDNSRAWGEPAPQNRPAPFMSVPIQQQQQQQPQGQYPEAPPPQPPHHSARDLSMTPSPPPSQPPRRKSKIAKHNFLLAAFHFLSAYLLVGVVALGFLAYAMGSLREVQIDPDLQRIPNILWISCIALAVALGLGLFASLVEDRKIGFAFIGVLGALLFIQFVVTLRLRSHTASRLRTLTKHWDELPPIARSAVQYVGDCCGYANPLDRPGEFCSEDAKIGCKFSIKEAVYGVESLLNYSFFWAAVLSGILAVLIYFIACRQQKLQ